MFKSVLIANRGEIACRIIRTLKRMGIRAIAVYSEADRHALHVRMADEAVWIGGAAPRDSYLRGDAVLGAARVSGAEAVHPGYGFLSENADFAEACEAAGLAFIGPTPGQIREFGLKHASREIARLCGVPLLPGSVLLADADAALAAAEEAGYPVMLKSTAGGGGIGMQVCAGPEELRAQFDAVRSLGVNQFKDAGVFLERYVARARHVEVQIFGDGLGRVISLGERDCSLQRRNQKVVEETPAPGLDETVRAALHASAISLGKAVSYRSAGTVEFVYDAETGRFYFLEVNARLQVEHGVTEAVCGVDLVEWMLLVAAGRGLPAWPPKRLPGGHAIQARIYAEDPARNFRPSVGHLSHASFPETARVDTWVESGTEISPYYDPLLSKVIVHGADRAEALRKLAEALDATELAGIETNVDYLRHLARSPALLKGDVTTGTLRDFDPPGRTIEVMDGGTMTTVQAYPGRTGYWAVGVPPSGPMDSWSFRLANRILNNLENCAGLEMTVSGATLKFACATTVALCGARMRATLDGEPVAWDTAVPVRAGQVLALGPIEGPGCRTYLAVRGGLDVPKYLGSRATFTLGGFGGHAGRALRTGDILKLKHPDAPVPEPLGPVHVAATLTREWEVRVMYGPHGAPDFFTPDDIATIFAAEWTVHFHSARTGIRLVGPKPRWARPDGGEAGLHPSNLHDNAYAVGAVDFTGDMPIILGPDGPSLGGFVCPAVVIAADLWKTGQMRPGDKVRFVPVEEGDALRLRQWQEEEIRSLLPLSNGGVKPAEIPADVRLETRGATADAPEVVYRPSGDDYLLVEYGPPVLDLALRFRAHALMQALERQRPEGVLELTPGIRSLQIHFDRRRIARDALLDLLRRAEDALPRVDDMEVPSRIVHLPLSWDDPATRLAIEKYASGVRADAPWCPSNIEFIRRINGLESVDAVKEIVFGASYLVMGLGDVYLGAPVAVPIDPRHRLVTTKYNPARTWTPENAVGIGGAYLCVYGMEGPGGYQFVGRTIQMWNRYRNTDSFVGERRWLLRFFDQLRFFPVTAEELLDLRERFPEGRYPLRMEETTFRYSEYRAFLESIADEAAAIKARQQTAFDAERERWRAAGLDWVAEDQGEEIETVTDHVPDGCCAIRAPMPGNVWRLFAEQGQRVEAGETVAILEAMKMEVPVASPASGVIAAVLVVAGKPVQPGQVLCVVEADP